MFYSFYTCKQDTRNNFRLLSILYIAINNYNFQTLTVYYSHHLSTTPEPLHLYHLQASYTTRLPSTTSDTNPLLPTTASVPSTTTPHKAPQISLTVLEVIPTTLLGRFTNTTNTFTLRHSLPNYQQRYQLRHHYPSTNNVTIYGTFILYTSNVTIQETNSTHT